MIRFSTVGLAFLVALSVFSPRTSTRTIVRAALQAAEDTASRDAAIGQVSAIASDPHDSATFYAATGRGIFKSTDGTETWKVIPPETHAGNVFRKVLVDPDHSNIIYTQGDTTILKSTDGGASWTSLAGNLTDGPFLTLALSPVDPSVLFATSQHNIFETVDGGQTWRAISSGLKRAPFRLLIDPQNPTVIYGLSDELLAKSNDGAEHWTRIGPRVPPDDITTIVMSPQDSSVLYVGTVEHGIYKSTDAGKKWFERDTGLMTRNMNEIRKEIPRVWAIAIDPSDPRTIYAGVSANLTGGMVAAIFKSTNSGKSWRLLRVIGRATGSSVVMCLLVDPFDHNVVFAGTEGDGIYKSTDGGENWSPESSTLATADLVGFDLSKSDGAPYAATAEGVFHFGGQHWRQVGSSYRDLGKEWVSSIAVDPTNSSTVYVGTRSSYDSTNGGVFKTTDGGRSWSEVDAGLPRLALWISALAVDPMEPSTVYAGTTGSGIYKTTNGGKNWMASDLGIRPQEKAIIALSVEAKDSSTVYALTPGFVWKSSNSGLTWTSSEALPVSEEALWRSRLTAFAISPSNPSLMYAAHFAIERGKGAATVFESNDGGLNWFLVGSAEGAINHLAVDSRSPTRIYADNGYDGILKSTDSGRTWTAMNLGLPRPLKYPLGFPSKTQVTGLALDPIQPDTIYISTGGRGVFESTDGGSSWHSEP